MAFHLCLQRVSVLWLCVDRSLIALGVEASYRPDPPAGWQRAFLAVLLLFLVVGGGV